MVTKTVADVWREKTDDQLLSAADHLADYTEDAEQVIRAELRRRELPEPQATTRFVPRARGSLFAGRMERSKFFLIWLGINLLALLLSSVIPYTIVVLVAIILFILPIAKRLHDLGYSAGACALLFVPVVNIALFLVLLFKKGQGHINQYG